MPIEAFSSDDLAKLEIRAPFLHKLLRHKASDLRGLLKSVETHSLVSSTKTSAHCYFLALDGNGRPRVDDLIRKISEKVIDYAIPRSQINSAIRECTQRNIAEPMARLNKKALSLFSHLKKTGEGGEILLSILAESFLELPQILAKMSLKTNPNSHYLGSDGIHSKVDETTGRLALYWGESKLYQDVGSAISACFTSLSPFLLDVSGTHARQERDLQLLRDGIDLDDPDLEMAFQKFLDRDDENFNLLEYRGLCLVGFDSDAYPNAGDTKTIDSICAEVKDSLSNWKAKIENQVRNKNLENFVIEIFCVPFPSVENFREKFLNELGVSNGTS